MARGGENVGDGGLFQHGHVRAAGSPDAWIGAEENRDHGRSDGGGKMCDAGIVADVGSRGGEPTSELVQVLKSDSFIQLFFGEAVHFTGTPSCAATARKFAIGQRL